MGSIALKAILVLKAAERERFMRFMERYAAPTSRLWFGRFMSQHAVWM